MPKHPEPTTIFPGENAQHREVMAALTHIGQRLDAIEQGQVKLMAKVDDDATAVAANTAQLRQITTNIQTAIEGQATIEAEVAALKARITAAGTPVDTTALDAAVADQSTAMSALAALAPAAT